MSSLGVVLVHIRVATVGWREWVVSIHVLKGDLAKVKQSEDSQKSLLGFWFEYLVGPGTSY